MFYHKFNFSKTVLPISYLQKSENLISFCENQIM